MITRGEHLQKPGTKIKQLSLSHLPIESYNNFVKLKLEKGEYEQHLAYSVDGVARPNLLARNSVKIVPNMRVELSMLFDQLAQDYFLENFEQDGSVILPFQSELFSYPVGIGIIPHIDDHVMSADGVRIGFDPYRSITGILYLNDDYEGGELVFPELDLVFKPKPGDMFLFPSNRNFLHGVNPITSGRRNSYQRIWAIVGENGSFVHDPEHPENELRYNCCPGSKQSKGP